MVAGGDRQENNLGQLNHPVEVIVDKDTDSLIISGGDNRRIIRWIFQEGTRQEAILDDIDCTQLAHADQRYLYVSSGQKNEVRLYRLGDRQGAVVAGGHGQGTRLN